jgi:hypothetical protein
MGDEKLAMPTHDRPFPLALPNPYKLPIAATATVRSLGCETHPQARAIAAGFQQGRVANALMR